MKALLLQRRSLQREIELPLKSTKLKSESRLLVALGPLAFVLRVMKGGDCRTYLHFLVLTLWNYLPQGASHTIRFVLHRFMLGIYCMTMSRSWKWKRVLPIPGTRDRGTQTICAKGYWAPLCFPCRVLQSRYFL